MPGKFIKTGSKWSTMYEETAAQMPVALNDFYGYSIKMAKSAGAAVYGDNGYFNAIMGKEITAGMFASDNLLTAIGARPYAHEGVRIASELASFVSDDAGAKTFQFPGLGTVQDGAIGPSVSMPIEEIREPYKDLPFPFDYGLGLMALENKDDTVAYKDYVDMMGKQYTDGLDKSICRPSGTELPVTDGRETTLETIGRVIGSYAEAVDSGKTAACVPYGRGEQSDLWKHRNYANGSRNMDGQYVKKEEGSDDTIVDLCRRLYKQCAVHWADSANPNNKIWAMTHNAQEALASAMAAGNIYLDSVYVQKDFNGVKTMPGRDAGMLLAAFENTPIIQDGNMAYDYANGVVSAETMGDINLLDLDNTWLGVLTPVELYTITNPAITRTLRESNVMSMRAEVRSDRFIGSGKIVGL